MAANAGVGWFFMSDDEERLKFAGHSLGLELDELPVLGPKFASPIQAGQTIALEPKFFSLPKESLE